MNVEINEVKGKGKGLFASKDFEEGEHILEITGDVIETEDPSSYPEEITEHWAPLGMKGKKYRFITPEEPWIYMNHSCDSNAGIINDRKLIAKRKIKKGDEINTDYSSLDIESLTQGKDRLMMECMCGSENCRKVITAFDGLKKEDQEKLKPYLNDYMKKKYLPTK
jgi:hypothetical protein